MSLESAGHFVCTGIQFSLSSVSDAYIANLQVIQYLHKTFISVDNVASWVGKGMLPEQQIVTLQSCEAQSKLMIMKELSNASKSKPYYPKYILVRKDKNLFLLL